MEKKKAKPSALKSTKIMFWSIGIIFLLFIAVIFYSKTSEKDMKEVAIDYTNQPYIGEDSAPVNIIEFGDYKCPYCKDFNESTYPIIKKELVDSGKAKFYFINYSLINETDSPRSAKFAETVYHELGNEVFWKFHEKLYKKQPEDPKYESEDIFTESFLEDTLNEIVSKEETEKVVKSFRDHKYDEAFEKDMSLVDELDITGTPTILVNGKPFKGNTMEDLIKMVDEAASGE